MALLYPTSKNFVQKALDAQLLSGATSSLTLNNTVGVQNKPGVCIVDRVSTTGAETEAKREVIKFTAVSGNTLTGLTRNADNSGTDQSHEVGAIVEFVADALWAQEICDLLDGTDSGASFNAPVLTSPKVGTAIADTNGNEIIKTPATSSAVNEITVTNAATGGAPKIAATGDDTNIELQFDAKGSKQIKLNRGFYQALQTYTPDAAATATLDLSLGNDHRITMPAGNITIALSNEQVGQKFLISITQDSGGSRTVTWFSTIKWSGGSAPTLTTTGNKRDTFGFVVTGSGTYDGFVVGQNI